MPGSAFGISRSSSRPPRPKSFTSSGIAFDRPPAPTSWIDKIGVSSPSAFARSITSWQRRCISGLSRCTLAKSKSALLCPVAIDDAAPPPSPIKSAGPPSTMIFAPTAMPRFFACMGRTLPMPPASMIGLW